jgi:hypothetical protein
VSSVEIGDSGTLKLRDHVLEHELALLEPTEHDLIHVWIDHEPADSLIQVLMLNAQLLESRYASENFSFDLRVH